MKRHFIAELSMLPEADLHKILNWALFQAQQLDDTTSWEAMVKARLYDLMWLLEKPES